MTQEENRMGLLSVRANAITWRDIMGEGDYDDIDFIFDMPKLKEVHLFFRVRRMPDRDRRFKRGIQISR